MEWQSVLHLLSYLVVLFLFPLCSSGPADTLPEGLTRELPSADEFQKLPAADTTTTAIDDLEELRKQLDALNT